jgi:hypothetical protein
MTFAPDRRRRTTKLNPGKRSTCAYDSYDVARSFPPLGNQSIKWPLVVGRPPKTQPLSSVLYALTPS